MKMKPMFAINPNSEYGKKCDSYYLEQVNSFLDFFRNLPMGTTIEILEDRFEYCCKGMFDVDGCEEDIAQPLTYKEIKAIGLIPVEPGVGLLKAGTKCQFCGVRDELECFSPYLSIKGGRPFTVGCTVEIDPNQTEFKESFALKFRVIA